MNKIVIVVLIALAAGLAVGMAIQRAIDKSDLSGSGPNRSIMGEDPSAPRTAVELAGEKEKLRRLEKELHSLKEELRIVEMEKNALENRRSGESGHEAVSGPPDEVSVNTVPEPAEKKGISAEDIRKYAKALAKMNKLKQEGKNPDSDPEVQSAMMELIGDFIKLTAKSNIDLTSPMGFYNAPEVRQLVYDLTEAFFDEMSMPLSEFQKSKIREIIGNTGMTAEKMKDDSISAVQKQIDMYDFCAEKNRELHNILNADQYNLMADGEIVPIMSVFGGYTRSVWDKTEDSQGAQNVVLSKWAEEMELNDSEKQNLTASSERFVFDYSELKNSLESKYGSEFMDLFLTEPGKDKKEIESFLAKKKEYEEKDPDYKTKTMEVETEFLKLQLKYQQEMADYLSKEKEDAIKKQSPLIFKFPYIK